MNPVLRYSVTPTHVTSLLRYACFDLWQFIHDRVDRAQSWFIYAVAVLAEEYVFFSFGSVWYFKLNIRHVLAVLLEAALSVPVWACLCLNTFLFSIAAAILSRINDDGGCGDVVYSVDLKAFERRLTDVISQLQPVAVRWRGKFSSLCFLLNVFCYVPPSISLLY